MEISGKAMDAFLEIKISGREIKDRIGEKMSLEDRWIKGLREVEKKIRKEKEVVK